MNNTYLIRFFRKLESFLYRRADLIAVHSEGNRRIILNSGGDFDRVTVLPNWIDTKAIHPGPRQNRLRASLGLDDRFIVSFAGIMGYSQDLATVLHSARLLQDQKDIAFLLVGDGVEKPKLQSFALAHHLDNVVFLPLQPKEKYPEVLQASDLCLVTLRQEVKTPVVPSKILSIMAAGRPILASLPPDGDAPRLIAEAQCGQTISPNDPQAMAQAIFQLYHDPMLLEKMGAQGRRYAVRHFSSEAAAEFLENSLSRLRSSC